MISPTRFTLPAAALGFSLTLLASTSLVAADSPKVVTSIKPVHSLTAAIMAGVAEPDLFVAGAASPHAYSLKPSQAAKLQDADVVFWVGPGLETFLTQPIETIAKDATIVTLAESPELTLLPIREGATFETHDHDDHDAHADHDKHDDHDEHAAHDDHDEHDHDEHAKHDDHDDHDHDEHAKHDDHDEHDHDEHAEHDDHADHDHDEHAEHDDHDEHDHDEHAAHDDHDEHDHDEHAHGAIDAHMWLDPKNAQIMTAEIAHALSEADPDNASTYQANADAVNAQLDELILEVSAMLEPVGDQGFIVLHDAYQYFEKRFGLNASGAITLSPEVPPSAQRVSEIQSKLGDLNVACVFAEPQFEAKIVTTITEGTDVETGVLDPLGANIEDGPGLYANLIRSMAMEMRDCLTKQG